MAKASLGVQLQAVGGVLAVMGVTLPLRYPAPRDPADKITYGLFMAVPGVLGLGLLATGWWLQKRDAGTSSGGRFDAPPAVTGWTECRHCRLKHRRRPDKQCPRCHKPT